MNLENSNSSQEDTISIEQEYYSVKTVLLNILNANSVTDKEIQQACATLANKAEILFYSPIQKQMHQVSEHRLESDSIASILLNISLSQSEKTKTTAEQMAHVSVFINQGLAKAIEKKEIFDKFLHFFTSEKNSLVIKTSHIRNGKISSKPYEDMAKVIIKSEMFNQQVFEDLLNLGVKLHKYHKPVSRIGAILYQGDHYMPIQYIMTQIKKDLSIDQRVKDIIINTYKNPISKRFKKEHFINTLNDFIIFNNNNDYQNFCAGMFIILHSDINKLDESKKSLLYYFNKLDINQASKEHLISILKDLGAVSIRPGVVVQFMGLVSSITGVLKELVAKQSKIKKDIKTSKDLGSLKNAQSAVPESANHKINQIDFSKFTSSERERQECKKRFQVVFQRTKKLLDYYEVHSNEPQDLRGLEQKMFLKIDVLEKFIPSTLHMSDFVKGMDFVSVQDTQNIFQSWTQQLEIIEKKLVDIEQTVKSQALSGLEKDAKVSLNVLKMKSST